MQYKTDKVAQARVMVDVGWSIAETSRRLGVSKTTVRVWTDDAYAERRRRRTAELQRRRRAGHAQAPYYGRTDEAKLKRIRTLSAAGLSPTQIGRVVGIDFGEPAWPRHRIELALRENRIPKLYRNSVIARGEATG